MKSRTPSRLSYTSTFETLITWNPRDSSTRVRSMSWSNSPCVECVAPSTSTMSFPSRVTKSTMYLSIGCWRRNFQRASRRLRNAYQRRDSALVCEARSCRAFFLKRSIPLIPLTRRLRRRPLPVGASLSTDVAVRVNIYCSAITFAETESGVILSMPSWFEEAAMEMRIGYFGDVRRGRSGEFLAQRVVNRQTVCMRNLADDRSEQVRFRRFLANQEVTVEEMVAYRANLVAGAAKGRHVLA